MKSSEPETFTTHNAKVCCHRALVCVSTASERYVHSPPTLQDSFLDLRIDMRDRVSATRSSASGCSKVPAFSPSTKAAYSDKATAAAAHSGALAPSNLQHALRYRMRVHSVAGQTRNSTDSDAVLFFPIVRRCQSASTIRRKLLHAVEQSSSQMTHDQLAILRSIASSAAAKPTSKRLLSRQLSSDTMTTSTHSMTTASRPSSATGSQLPPHPHKSRDQDTFASSSTTPTRAKTLKQAMLDTTAKHPQQQRARIVGGFKSGAVQLEVELVERLNEIDRSKVCLFDCELSLRGSSVVPSDDLCFVLVHCAGRRS